MQIADPLLAVLNKAKIKIKNILKPRSGPEPAQNRRSLEEDGRTDPPPGPPGEGGGGKNKIKTRLKHGWAFVTSEATIQAHNSHGHFFRQLTESLLAYGQKLRDPDFEVWDSGFRRFWP